MHTCYKIYGYFEFQIFTYHLSSVVHSATLMELFNLKDKSHFVNTLLDFRNANISATKLVTADVRQIVQRRQKKLNCLSRQMYNFIFQC